jgi:type IV pilus assembly protein PilA
MTLLFRVSRFSLFTGFLAFIAVVAVGQIAEAQRPSVAEIQAELDAINDPYNQPSGQVSTALDILPTFSEAVARYYHATGVPPQNRMVAGLSQNATDTFTSFITEVDVYDGAVIFTFGNYAAAEITGENLVFRPYVTADDTVIWQCGDNPIPGGAASLSYNSSSTTIPAEFVPNPCLTKSYTPGLNDIIRAQVRSALDLLDTFTDAVVRNYHQTGQAPQNRTEAGLSNNATDTFTKYISSVDIDNGTVVFQYGNDANAVIAFEELTFKPYVTEDDTVIWVCGDEQVPGGANEMSYGYGASTTIEARYLPRPCNTKAYPSTSIDTIRAQVEEPFDIVERFKDAIEAAGAALGSIEAPIPPVNRTEAGLSNNATDTFGNYFSSVDVDNGVIRVSYAGDRTHSMIYGNQVDWTPYETPDGTIVWVCGYANAPYNAQPMGTNAGQGGYPYPNTNIPPVYLPPQCR